jgi:hypothetical protein
MIIIWGIKRFRANLGVVVMLCQRCGNPCAQTVARLRSWFALFFIPLIPLGTHHRMVCSMCAVVTRIDKAQAISLQQAALAQRSQAPRMTADGPITSPSAPRQSLPTGNPPAYPPTPRSAPNPSQTGGGSLTPPAKIVIGLDDLA